MAEINWIDHGLCARALVFVHICALFLVPLCPHHLSMPPFLYIPRLILSPGSYTCSQPGMVCMSLLASWTHS